MRVVCVRSTRSLARNAEAHINTDCPHAASFRSRFSSSRVLVDICIFCIVCLFASRPRAFASSPTHFPTDLHPNLPTCWLYSVRLFLSGFPSLPFPTCFTVIGVCQSVPACLPACLVFAGKGLSKEDSGFATPLQFCGCGFMGAGPVFFILPFHSVESRARALLSNRIR